jgi:hypothetical protein
VDGVPRPIKVKAEDAKKVRAENGWLLTFEELERVGCFLPWEKGEEKKTPSVAVHCCVRNPMGLLSGRLRLKKLAFLQERDDWFSTAFAE